MPARWLLALLLTSALSHAADAPFGLQVIDETTRRGVPMVVLETADHARFVSDSAGWIAIAEPGLMRHRVRFSISSPGYAFAKDEDGQPSLTVDLVPGSTQEIQALRADIAQRYYRTTGAGIYRDSTLLARDAPLPRPNLNSGILTQQGAQAALHEGRVFWAWSHTRLVSQAQPLTHGVGAWSELPTGKGLDPTQGIHFDYLLDAKGSPLDLLPSEEPGDIALDGLASVPDEQGTAHLIAHYSRSLAGAIAEQGLAEWNAGTSSFERLIVLGSDYGWQFPQGHAEQVSDASGKTWLYFATPLCHTRCPATYEAVLNPASYQAYALDAATKSLGWQQAAAPLSSTAAATLSPLDVLSGKPIVLTSGSIRWNAYRQRFIFLAAGSLKSNAAPAGEVWYAEATAIEGPWSKAHCVVSHLGARFDHVSQWSFFDQKESRVIYFEGCLSSTDARLPRYDGNSLLYSLDLADERLQAASAKK